MRPCGTLNQGLLEGAQPPRGACWRVCAGGWDRRVSGVPMFFVAFLARQMHESTKVLSKRVRFRTRYTVKTSKLAWCAVALPRRWYRPAVGMSCWRVCAGWCTLKLGAVGDWILCPLCLIDGCAWSAPIKPHTSHCCMACRGRHHVRGCRSRVKHQEWSGVASDASPRSVSN